MLLSQRGKKKNPHHLHSPSPCCFSLLFFPPFCLFFPPLESPPSPLRREPQITPHHHIKEKMRGKWIEGERGGGVGESQGGGSTKVEVREREEKVMKRKKREQKWVRSVEEDVNTWAGLRYNREQECISLYLYRCVSPLISQCVSPFLLPSYTHTRAHTHSLHAHFFFFAVR